MSIPAFLLRSGAAARMTFALTALVGSAHPLAAQLLTNLQSFPDRISVGDPLVASLDHKEGPKGVATADFNGDGKPDLAAGNLDGTVTVLMGVGGGRFEPPRHIRTGAQELRSVLATDLNGDAKPDLAVASPMDGKLVLYFNDGHGNFPAATPLSGWQGVRCLASGDFDGDGLTDLAAAGPGLGLRHFRGTGGGAFEVMGDLPRLSSSHAGIPRPVFTMRTIRSRDGLRDDLLVTHADSPELWILSTVPADRSQEPPMSLTDLPAWKSIPSPLLINEVQVHNANTLRDADGTAQPWMEILNKSAAPVALTGWSLIVDDAEPWPLPAVSIEPGRMLIVFLSGKDRVAPDLHAALLLKQNSRTIQLVQPAGGVAHELQLAEHAVPDISFGLAPDLNAVRYFDIPSPGAENNAGTKNLDGIHHDASATLTITPRNPAPGESVKVRVTLPGPLTGSSSVRNVWFSSTPGLYEDHYLLHKKSAGIFEEVLPPGAFTGETPHRVLARLRDGTGNDYTSEIHRGLDESESARTAVAREGRLQPVASLPSPGVKSFEIGVLDQPANAPGAAQALVFADEVNGLLQVHPAGPGARRFEPLPSQSVPVRGAPRDVKLSDTNGDGWLDATVVLRALDLALTFKNENGTLTLSGELPTGRSPREAVMADFTGDGRADAAVINRYSADVSILPSSTTQGLVTLDQIYPVGGDVSGLIVQDVNGDGRDDVIQLHRASGEMSLRKASPDGTLGAPEFRSIGSESPSGMEKADVNNDGITDVLSANLGFGGGGTLSVMLGKPDGTFAAPRTINGVGGMFAVAVADFDKDGNQDVAAGLFDCRIEFLRGDGTGNFSSWYSVRFTYESRVMVAGDFDQDGDTDLAGAGYAGDMVTLENLGATTAEAWARKDYPRNNAQGTYRIAITNINFDADPDLVIGTGRGMLAFLGDTGMNFRADLGLSGAVTFPVSDVIMKDLDNDGSIEMIAACRAASCINILTQAENGEFMLRAQADVPSGKLLASGDIDGDGKADLVGTGDVLWTVLSSRAPKTAPPTSGEGTRPVASEIVINEILSQNTGIPLSSDDGKTTDFVEIYNGTAGPAVLTGWKVRLQATQEGVAVDKTWTLPATTTPVKGHTVILFSDEPGPSHTGFTLPAEGGKVTLLRGDDSIVDEVVYPNARESVSWSRYLDGHPVFHADAIPSPGMSNLDNGTVPPEVSLTPPSPATLVPFQPVTFTAKGRDDAGIISLSLLWNRLDAPLSEPGRIVLYDDGMHQDGAAVDGIFSGRLAPGLPPGSEVQFYLEAVNLSGDVLLLPDSAELVKAGESPVAWSFSLTQVPSLEISEVSASNVTMVRDELGGRADFVKVRNTGANTVSMSGILLAKSPLAGSSSTFAFPPALTLPPGGEITVFADDAPAQGALHAPFTIDSRGDDLSLLAVRPSGVRQWIHSLKVPASGQDSVYRRLPGTNLRAVLAGNSVPANWSGTVWNDAGEAFATVQFTATAGSNWRVEGDAPGAPVEWSVLQIIPGDNTVHTITVPLAEMSELRALSTPALPSVRIDSLMPAPRLATIFGEALRATDTTVFFGPVDRGSDALAWPASFNSTGSTIAGTMTSLNPATLYYCRVRARNAVGEVWSNAQAFVTLAADAPVPDLLTLMQLNPTDVRVDIHIQPSFPGAVPTLLAGTIDAFGNVGAWPPQKVEVTLKAGSNLWTASLTGLNRETNYFVRAVLTTPTGQIVSAPRLTFRTPGTQDNIVYNLRLTELMYHPAWQLSPAEAAAGFEESDFEFIELQNASSESMDLSGLWFENGVDFAFPLSGGTVLPPGAFAVIAANPHAFAMRYGSDIPLAGWTLHPFHNSRLANGGEKVTLRTADGTMVLDFNYLDRIADGDGFTIEYHPSANPYAAENFTQYMVSVLPGGTPGSAALPPGDLTLDAWRAAIFNPAQLGDVAISGPSSDPDRDGHPNIAEFLSGSDPMVADSRDLLTIADGGDGTLLLTFPVNLRARQGGISLEGKIFPASSWVPQGSLNIGNTGNRFTAIPPVMRLEPRTVVSPDGRTALMTMRVQNSVAGRWFGRLRFYP